MLPYWKEAGLIEIETDERRTSNIDGFVKSLNLDVYEL